MEVNFNNKTLKPFITRTYPSIFNLPSTSSVCLVGNGGVMMEKEWGNEIDNYDIVIRFNHAPTKGFEKNVGSKTNIRLVNGHCFGGETDPKRNPTADPMFLPNLEPQDIICKTCSQKQFISGTLNNINKHNLYFINPEFIDATGFYTQPHEPSAGFVMFMLLLSHFTNINLYGFTFWEDSYDYHYFEKVPLDASQLGHNFSHEKSIVLELEKQNKIKIHK